MLRVMRDPTADDNRRDHMAKAAAPYCHARLATIDHKNSDGSLIVPVLNVIESEPPSLLVNREPGLASAAWRSAHPCNPETAHGAIHEPSGQFGHTVSEAERFTGHRVSKARQISLKLATACPRPEEAKPVADTMMDVSCVSMGPA